MVLQHLILLEQFPVFFWIYRTPQPSGEIINESKEDSRNTNKQIYKLESQKDRKKKNREKLIIVDILEFEDMSIYNMYKKKTKHSQQMFTLNDTLHDKFNIVYALD